MLEIIGDAAEAESAAAKLLLVLQHGFVLKNATVTVGPSIGVAVRIVVPGHSTPRLRFVVEATYRARIRPFLVVFFHKSL